MGIKTGFEQLAICIQGATDVLPYVTYPEPKTIFRKGALVSLAIAKRIERKRLKQNQYKSVSHFLEASVCLNDRYDEERFNEAKYTHHIKGLIGGEINCNTVSRFMDFAQFQLLLEQTELNRPDPLVTDFSRVKRYREVGNLLNITFATSLAFEGDGQYSFGDLINAQTHDQISTEPPQICQYPSWLQSLYYNTMALQIIDDLAGWKGDLIYNRPSFVTGKLTPDHGQFELDNCPRITKELGAEFKRYLQLAGECKSKCDVPLSIGVRAARVYPTIQKVSNRFGINIPMLTSKREMQECY